MSDPQNAMSSFENGSAFCGKVDLAERLAAAVAQGDSTGGEESSIPSLR